MFWGKWNVRKRPDLTWDLKVHAFRENVLGNIDEKVEDVNLDDLWKHIFELGKLREEGNHKQARSLGHFPWPNVFDLQNLKGYVLLRSDLPIDGDVKEILWRVNVATVAPLVVAHALERLDASITNREELWHLTEVMYDLAIALKTLSESPEGTQDVMQEATSLIVEGARMFSLRSGCRRSASEGNEIIQKLNTMYMYINTEFTVSAFTPIQHQRRCHLSKQYPTQPESDPFYQPLPEASHDEAPFSRSLNVSMKLKGKNVDVSLYDEASSDLPKTSEDFHVNLNISGAPRCNEAPSSSSSSSGPTKSKFDLISNICKYIDKDEDFNLDDLMKHMSELLKLREKGNHQEASILGHFHWPDFPGLQKLKEIVSFGDLRIKDIHGPVKALLKEIGRVNVATAAPLVVTHTLERFDAIFTNREKCCHLIKEMYDVATVLKILRESAEGMQDVMQEATSLIIEGVLVCFTQAGHSAFTRPSPFPYPAMMYPPLNSCNFSPCLNSPLHSDLLWNSGHSRNGCNLLQLVKIVNTRFFCGHGECTATSRNFRN